MFVLLFENGSNDLTRDSFIKFTSHLKKKKNQPVKDKQEAYEKLFEMSRNDDFVVEIY